MNKLLTIPIYFFLIPIVPKKGRSNARGAALMGPGEFHDEIIHNAKNDPFPSEQFVTENDARAFKYWQSGKI